MVGWPSSLPLKDKGPGIRDDDFDPHHPAVLPSVKPTQFGFPKQIIHIRGARIRRVPRGLLCAEGLTPHHVRLRGNRQSSVHWRTMTPIVSLGQRSIFRIEADTVQDEDFWVREGRLVITFNVRRRHSLTIYLISPCQVILGNGRLGS